MQLVVLIVTRYGSLFISDAAVADLVKLDEDIASLTNAIDEDGDMQKMSHLVYAFTHRLCRTLEESKAACNRAPPEQGDGM